MCDGIFFTHNFYHAPLKRSRAPGCEESVPHVKYIRLPGDIKAKNQLSAISYQRSAISYQRSAKKQTALAES